MSVIGPRPLLVSYLPYYTEEEHHRHDVRPGLSGWAQVNGRTVCGWDKKATADVALHTGGVDADGVYQVQSNEANFSVNWMIG